MHGVFPVPELFWFCLVQVSTTHFCSFSFFLMERVDDGIDVPVSLVPASSSNMGSPNGSLPDLDGTGFRACTMEKINEIFTQIAKFHYSCRVNPGSKIVSRRSPRQWLHILQKSQILNKSSAAFQPVLPHWKRMQLLSPVVPARQDLGTFLYMVTSSDDSRNTRRRLDTFASPEDEQARCAVLLRFLLRTMKQSDYKVDR